MDHFGLKTLCWHCCCFLVSFLPCFWKKWIKSKPTVIAATATANKNPDWYPFPHLSMRTDQRTAGRSSTNLEQPTVTTFGPRQLAAKVFVKLPTPMTVGFRSVDLGLVHPFFLNHAEPKKTQPQRWNFGNLEHVAGLQCWGNCIHCICFSSILLPFFAVMSWIWTQLRTIDSFLYVHLKSKSLQEGVLHHKLRLWWPRIAHMANCGTKCCSGNQMGNKCLLQEFVHVVRALATCLVVVVVQTDGACFSALQRTKCQRKKRIVIQCFRVSDIQIYNSALRRQTKCAYWDMDRVHHPSGFTTAMIQPFRKCKLEPKPANTRWLPTLRKKCQYFQNLVRKAHLPRSLVAME